MTSPSRPPLLATWVLGLVLPSNDRAHVLGDLFEEYEIRTQAQAGPAAVWWYWGQVCRSLAPLLMSIARRRRWRATVGVAVIGFIAASATGTAAETMLSRLLGDKAGVPILVHGGVGLATLLMGGYVAARIRPRAEDVMAVIVLVVVAGMMTMAGRAPGWYAMTVVVVGPATALAGGRLSRR